MWLPSMTANSPIILAIVLGRDLGLPMSGEILRADVCGFAEMLTDVR